MFATIRQTRADERNLFQVESEESGILYRAETPWSGLNLPFDAENLRKLVFTDDGGKEMFHTEYDIVRNTVNSLLKYRYLAGKSVRLSEYRVTGSDGAELGAFYTRIDGALTSQMVISFGGRLYDCYHYALGRIYVISIFDRGRQIAQITKPLDTWNQLDVYYLHLIDSCRDMLPVLSFFTVWVDAARFDGAGRFARYSYQKSRVRTFNRNNDKYDPDWIAKTFGNEAAEQLDFLLETHPEKDSPGARIPEKAARRLKMIIAAVIFSPRRFCCFSSCIRRKPFCPANFLRRCGKWDIRYRRLRGSTERTEPLRRMRRSGTRAGWNISAPHRKKTRKNSFPESAAPGSRRAERRAAVRHLPACTAKRMPGPPTENTGRCPASGIPW